jgi:hypothetical protein
MPKLLNKGAVEKTWCVEFWDFGAWNEWADTRCQYKAQAVEIAQKMNRETDHDAREGAFEGHRFRVRKVRP